MKKTVWAAIAVLALAVTIPALAQPPQGPGGGFGRRGMGPGAPGGPGGPGRGGFVFRELNLTDAQKEQIRAIHEERRTERPGAGMMELQKQLQAAVFADTPDVAKIEQLKSQIASAEAALLSARIDTELRIAQILTPEQKAKARELVAKGPEGRGRRGRP